MTALKKVLSKIDPTYQAFGIIAGVLAIGLSLGFTLSGFTTLPEQVEAITVAVAENTAAVSKNDQWQVQHTKEFRSLVCLITQPDSISSVESLRACDL